MITTKVNYGRQGTPSTGHKTSQLLDAATFVTSGTYGGYSTYVVEMDRDYRNRPHTSLLIGHRVTSGSYVAHVHLFGTHGDGKQEADWYGPFASVAISSTELAGCISTANCRLIKDIGDTDWICGPTKQVDTQDWPVVAALLTIDSTAAAFGGGSGIQLDLHVQDVTS